jgi:3-oxoacyl-[acyl-carrier protein] reductase
MDLTLEDRERALDVNSFCEMIRTFVPGMRTRRIVNITSATARMPVERLDLSTSARLALAGHVAGVARHARSSAASWPPSSRARTLSSTEDCAR